MPAISQSGAKNTGDLIIKEESSIAGVRRIKAAIA